LILGRRAAESAAAKLSEKSGCTPQLSTTNVSGRYSENPTLKRPKGQVAFDVGVSGC